MSFDIPFICIVGSIHVFTFPWIISICIHMVRNDMARNCDNSFSLRKIQKKNTFEQRNYYAKQGGGGGVQ